MHQVAQRQKDTRRMQGDRYINKDDLTTLQDVRMSPEHFTFCEYMKQLPIKINLRRKCYINQKRFKSLSSSWEHWAELLPALWDFQATEIWRLKVKKRHHYKSHSHQTWSSPSMPWWMDEAYISTLLALEPAETHFGLVCEGISGKGKLRGKTHPRISGTFQRQPIYKEVLGQRGFVDIFCWLGSPASQAF